MSVLSFFPSPNSRPLGSCLARSSFTPAPTIPSTWSQRSLAQHLAFAHADAGGELGGVAVTVQRHGGAQVFDGTELLAM